MTRGKVARNAISLYGLHGASYLLPLIAFPYLLSILGVSGFGLYGFIVAVARYGILITEWGFNFTASRAISERLVRDEEVGSVYGSTTAARAGLLAVVAAGLGALTIFVPQFRNDADLFWIAFVGVAGSAMFPLWLFQAFHRLPLVIGVNVAARAVAVGLLFLLAKDAGDLNIVLWLWSAPWVVTAVAAMILARTSLKVPFVVPRLRGAWSTLIEGRHVFVSNAAVTLYTAGNAVLLGILASTEEVGLYVAAETIVTALVGFVGPLGQAVFPRSSEIATRGRKAAVAHARRLLPWFGAVGGVLAAGGFLLAPVLGAYVFGDGFEESVRLLQLMSLIPLSVALATVLGQQLLIPLRLDQRYSTVVILAGVFNVALAVALVPSLGAWGTAIAVTITEALIVVGLLVQLRLARVIGGGRSPSPA